MRSKPDFIINGADELEAALASGEAAPMVLLRFDRREIERGEIAAPLTRLRIFSNSGNAVRMMANTAWLEVQGYDTDAREIYEIPECRIFFQKLAKAWNGWFHFLEKSGDSFRLFLAHLVEISVERRGTLVTNFRFTDFDELERVFQHQFGLMNDLYSSHHLSDAACRAMTDNVMAAFKRMAPATSH